MTKENISLTQLLALVVNFLLGSAIVVGIGKDSKNDAWLAVAVAGIIGAGIIWFYHKLISRTGYLNLFEILEFCFGRKISILVSFIYITYFLYIASRVIRDFCELIGSVILPNTPLEVISISLCLVIGYIIYLGIEVLARTSEIFTPYLFVFILLIILFTFASGAIDIKQIQPILGEGLKPVLKAVFPDLIGFPFGEIIAFTVVLPVVTRREYILRVSLAGVGIATFLLVLATFIMISTLGVDGMERANFPLLSVARNISIGGFVERIEAFVVFIMMLGILVKATVFLFAGLKGLEHIFKLPFRYFAIPGAMMIFIFSILVSESYGDHIEEGLLLVTKFLHPPFQYGIPVLLFIIVIFKQKKWKKGSSEVK